MPSHWQFYVGLLWSLHGSLALVLLLWEEERDTVKRRVNPLGIFIGLEGEAGKVTLKLKPNQWKLGIQLIVKLEFHLWRVNV